MVVNGLGDGIRVPVQLVQDSLENDAGSGTVRRRRLLQVSLATLFVNGTEVASDGSTLVDNGDQIKINLCASDQYETVTWIDMYVGTGADAVHDRVMLTTLAKPAHNVALTFDGQNHEVCAGQAVEVTWNGYHNIQETATSACDSSDVGNETLGFYSAGHVRVFVDDELAAAPGQTRYFKCDSHCSSTSARFAVTCSYPSPPPSPPSPPDAPVVVESPPPAPVVVSTQPVVAGPQTFSKLAVYAEQPLATDAELVELRINLADGSRVGNTTVDRIDANTFASTLQLPTYVPETQIALTNTASGWGTESDKKSAYLQIRSDQTGCPVDKCATEDVCYTAVTIKNDDTLYYGLGNDCNFFYRPSTDRWYGIITSSSAWGWPEPYVDETTNQWTVAPDGGAVQGQWPTSPRPKLFDGDHATVAITGAGPAVKNLMSEGYSFDGGWHSSVYELRLDSVTAQNTLVYKLYNTGTSVWVNSITIEYDLAQRVWRDLGSGNPKAITDTNVHDATSLETSSNPENVYCWESSTSLSVAFNNPYRDLATVAGPLTYDLPYEYSFKLKSHSYAHDDESDPASAADFVCKPSGVEVNENFNRDGSPAGCKIFNAGDINIGEGFKLLEIFYDLFKQDATSMEDADDLAEEVINFRSIKDESAQVLVARVRGGTI